MDPMLPNEGADARPEPSRLLEAEGWLPATPVSTMPLDERDDEPQRPETD